MIPIDFVVTVVIIIVFLIYLRNRNTLEKSDKEIQKEKLLNYAAIISVVVLIAVIIAFTNRASQGWPFSRNEERENDEVVVTEPHYNVREEQAVIMLVNRERSREGLDVLALDPGLRELARFQALDLLELDYYEQVFPGYSNLLEMVRSAGLVQYNTAAVNFVKSSGNAGDALESMMRSPHQLENIINENYTNIGVGVVEVSDRGPETFRLYLIIFAGT